MKINVFGGLRDNASRTNNRVTALIEGLEGTPIWRHSALPARADLYVQAGFQNSPALSSAMDRGIPFIVLENGFADTIVARRSEYTSVGYNGLGGLAYRPDPPQVEVHNDFIPLQPWNESDEGKIYIYGQMENDRALRGIDIDAWIADMVELYSVEWPEREIVVRPHPLMLDDPTSLLPLASTFDDTWLSVSWTSTAGIEAVIAGVGHGAMHPGSMVWDIEPGDDRAEWAWQLSWAQYRMEKLGTIGRDFLIAGYDEARSRAKDGLYDDPGPMPARYIGGA